MIVFDVRCGNGHRFEGWFRSGADFERQAADGAIACPLCEDTHVGKAPMAPYVSRGARGEPDRTAKPAPEKSAERKLVEAMTELRRKVEETCDYVGPGFPEEARRIHYGETDPHGIYGEATREEARELASEGIAVQRIPWLPQRND